MKFGRLLEMWDDVWKFVNTIQIAVEQWLTPTKEVGKEPNNYDIYKT